MNSGQTAQAELLAIRNYEAITDHIIANRVLNYTDAILLFEDLSKFLPTYTGELNDTDFLAWAFEVLSPGIFLHRLKKEHRLIVLKAFHTIVDGCPDFKDDRTFKDLEDDMWIWCFENLDSLREPGKAKLSTRLYDRARWIARAWKTNKVRARQRFVTLEELDGNHQSDDHSNHAAA